MNFNIFSLKSATEKAVFTFVSAHKLFYTNFDWVSLHIAFVSVLTDNIFHYELLLFLYKFDFF